MGPHLTLDYLQRCWANDERWEAVPQEVRVRGLGRGRAWDTGVRASGASGQAALAEENGMGGERRRAAAGRPSSWPLPIPVSRGGGGLGTSVKPS